MPTFEQAARVTVRGKDAPLPGASHDLAGREIPDTSPAELPGNSELIHIRALELAREKGSPFMHAGIAGYRWDGNVNKIIYELWPTMDRDPDNEVATSARKMLNAYLRGTLNMVCLSRGNATTPSTWWVRTVWNPDPPAVLPRPSAGARALNVDERRITPAQAGETRAAAPVETGYKCTWPGCEERYPTALGASQHHLAEHKNAHAYIKEALEQLEEPASVNEIHEAAVNLKYPGAIDTTRKALDELHAEGVAARRQMPVRGQTWRWVYVLASNPDPDWAGAVPEENGNGHSNQAPNTHLCREPGCPRGVPGHGFLSVDVRGTHEELEHPDMATRPLPCAAGCDPTQVRFYNLLSLGIHYGKGHRIAKTTDQYKRMMHTAERQLAQWEARGRTPLPPAPRPAERGDSGPAMPPRVETPVVPVPPAPVRVAPTETAVAHTEAVKITPAQALVVLKEYLDQADSAERLEEEVVALRRENRELREKMAQVKAVFGG